MRRQPSLRRQGSYSVVDVDGSANETVQGHIDRIGFGRYQWLLLAGIGGALLSESLEMGSVAPMHTALARAYDFSRVQRSALPLVTFLGSSIGLIVAGPICDWRGRKAVLMCSLVLITLSMFATALLPAAAPPLVILLLRFVSGFAGAIQVPAGTVLAVESCPLEARSQLIFGIQMIGAFGYLLEAVGVQSFMPHFGEDQADHWRTFSCCIGLSSLIVLPLVALLLESPTFLAVQGDADGCVRVLDSISRINGKPEMPTSISSPRPDSEKRLREVAGVFWAAVASHFPLLALLSLVDCSRSFFVAGSSYLWKDLFGLVRGPSMPPASLNIVASVAPLLGLAASERLLWIGVWRIGCLSALVATASLATLAVEAVRASSWKLLLCVMTVKLTYGPLNTCVALVKAEAFPTEIRASAYSVVSAAAKVMSILAPTLIELWKGDERAQSWTGVALVRYILILSIATLTCSAGTLLIPRKMGAGRQLRDYFEVRRFSKRTVSFSNIQELWDSDAEEEKPLIPHAHTAPNLAAKLA